MKSLIVLLDEAAPSFCYYESRPAATALRMTEPTFERVLAFADAHALSLQLVCGQQGPPEFVAKLIESRPHRRYMPRGAPGLAADDVLVLDGPEWETGALGPDRHWLTILRVQSAHLAQLAETWERLSKTAYRVVLVLAGIDRYEDQDLREYEAAVIALRQRLTAKYLDGDAVELSVLSDRLVALDAPSECGAGLDHITVTPAGDFYLCPGFALEGDRCVGNLSDGWQIPDAELLHRSKAPICSGCDAYHCRRCVYVNHRATLEVNTPPWQVCRAAFVEREASRVMLDTLHKQGRLDALPPLAPLGNVDPLDALMRARHGVPPTPEGGQEPQGPPEPREPPEPWQPPPTSAALDPAVRHCVGRVTTEERDTIAELHRRKIGLTAVLSAMAHMEEGSLRSTSLYERIVRDMGETTLAYDDWWNQVATRYGWKLEHGAQTWHVDFATCEVHLD